jgi:hypothetical protein
MDFILLVVSISPIKDFLRGVRISEDLAKGWFPPEWEVSGGKNNESG